MEFNFDAMDKDELVAFFIEHRNGADWTRVLSRDIVPNGITWKQATKIAKKLAEYALQKSAAMRYRESGKIDPALRHEKECDRIYNELPEWARW